jgi:hypothetical protein
MLLSTGDGHEKNGGQYQDPVSTDDLKADHQVLGGPLPQNLGRRARSFDGLGRCTQGCLRSLLALSHCKARRGHVNQLVLGTLGCVQSFGSPISDTCRASLLGNMEAWRGDKLNAHGISVRGSFTRPVCLFVCLFVGAALFTGALVQGFPTQQPRNHLPCNKFDPLEELGDKRLTHGLFWHHNTLLRR